MSWEDILKNKPFYGDRECPRCGSKMMTTFPNKAASLTGKDEVSYCTKCGYTEDEGTESTDSPIKKKIVNTDDCPECGEKHNGNLKFYPKYDKILCGKCESQYRTLHG